VKRRRASQGSAIVAGAVVIVAGFGVALVERYRMPKGSVWLVVGLAALVVFLVRLVGRRRNE
jgi:hypothetical protein